MIEFQGWANIAEAPDWEDDLDRLAQVVTEITAEAKRLNEDLRTVRLFVEEPLGHVVLIAGYFGHTWRGWDEIVNFFKMIGEKAGGSFGLLHFIDDEDKTGHVNDYQVLVMKRGKVGLEVDPFLSPYFPEIEGRGDEYDEALKGAEKAGRTQPHDR